MPTVCLLFWSFEVRLHAFAKVSAATPQINSVECPELFELLFHINIVLFCHLGECRSLRYYLLDSEDPFCLSRIHNTSTFLNPHTSSREWNSRSCNEWFNANVLCGNGENGDISEFLNNLENSLQTVRSLRLGFFCCSLLAVSFLIFYLIQNRYSMNICWLNELLNG